MTVLAVASGKGGTGKTTIASSLVLAMAGDGPVTAADADSEEPNLGLLLGIRPDYVRDVTLKVPVFDSEKCDGCGACVEKCRFGAIVKLTESRPFLNENLCHGCAVCSLVCPKDAVSERSLPIGTISAGSLGSVDFIEGRLNPGSPNPVPVIRSVMDLAREKPGIVVADSPPGTSCSMVEAVGHSDFALLVTEATPFGIADLELALEVVRDLGKKSAVVVNRWGLGGSDPSSLCRRFSVPVLGNIPFSIETAQAYGKGVNPYKVSSVWRKNIDEILSGLRKMGAVP